MCFALVNYHSEQTTKLVKIFHLKPFEGSLAYFTIFEQTIPDEVGPNNFNHKLPFGVSACLSTVLSNGSGSGFAQMDADKDRQVQGDIS